MPAIRSHWSPHHLSGWDAFTVCVIVISEKLSGRVHSYCSQYPIDRASIRIIIQVSIAESYLAVIIT